MRKDEKQLLKRFLKGYRNGRQRSYLLHTNGLTAHATFTGIPSKKTLKMLNTVIERAYHTPLSKLNNHGANYISSAQGADERIK
ncbi:hypothetical protein [Tellurirhabdus bombi]|uniref:hypothetical protein n=1 Tax=Tellurirhabdus bombi TaxID=2907205 RepID=UPI001F37398D|nr:hypothetical protein [Tellurirhabdus bombi]